MCDATAAAPADDGCGSPDAGGGIPGAWRPKAPRSPDTRLVLAVFNAVAGISPAYRRTLDLDPAPTPGWGSAKVDSGGVGIEAHFNASCSGSP